jgi:flagellar hook-associated protein 2
VDATTVVGTGTVTIQFGVWQNGAFTVNPDRSPVDVVIDGTNQSLAGIRDAINAARAGVTATILNDGNGRRLVLSGDRTGAANGLRVLVDDAGDGNDVDAAGLSALAWDPAGSPGAGRNLAEVAAARDALLNVDGVNDIRRADNVLRDLVDGVVVTLLKEGAPGVPVSVTVARDPAGAQSAVRSFVAAANDLLKTLADLTAYDPVARRGAILQGDPTALGLMTQLRATLGAAVHPDPDRTLTLSGIGVGFRQDGTLALDEARLQQAMDADAEAVMALFAGGSGPGAEGLAVRLTRLAAHWLEGGGPVESRSDAVSAEIEALADRRAAIERRLEDVERRLRSQYTALDTLLGRLRSSSDFLAQQLDSLSALAAGRAGRR